MKENISLSTCIYAGYPDIHFTVDELIGHIKKTGYKNIEVSSWNFLEDLPLRELVEKTKKAGIFIPSIHCTHHYDVDRVNRDYELKPTGNRNKEEVFKEYHQRFYQDIYDVGLRKTIIVEHVPLDEKNLDLSLQRILVLKKINNKYGFTIVTENMPDPPREEQLYVLSHLLQEDGIYYCHDTNHAAQANFDPFDFLKFFPKLRDVHVVDNEPLCPFGDGVPPGLGRVPLEEILKKMVENGYNGPFTVEVYGFERQLQKVLQIAYSVYNKVHIPQGIDWRDIYASYSRKYLKEKLPKKKRDNTNNAV